MCSAPIMRMEVVAAPARVDIRVAGVLLLGALVVGFDSGTILATAGMSIGFLSSENTVASIGVCLGRGTLLSMVLVMCVLPQILLLGDSLVEKTSFTIGLHPATQQLHGAMRVNGHVRGYINGYVDAEIHGRVNGTVSASIDIGDVQMEELPAHVAPPAQLHSEEGSDEET